MMKGSSPHVIEKVPILRCLESSEIMFHVVGKIGSKDADREVPLEKVFSAKEWRDIVPASTYVLRKVTMREFLKNRKNLVLSYRWNNKIRVRCGGVAPANVSLPVQDRDLAIDFVRGLPFIEDASFLWVDFLCHLDVDVHRKLILNTMGELYTRAVVLPLYLFDFTVNRKSDDLMTAMRRGWIQQEISYGVLHRATTEHFIKTCIKSESFGELATFLRRRPKAMKWFVKAWKNDKSEDTSEDTVKIRSIQEWTAQI